jgi:hypothetical protein
MADRDSCLGYMRQMQGVYAPWAHRPEADAPHRRYASVRGESKFIIASEFVKN